MACASEIKERMDFNSPAVTINEPADYGTDLKSSSTTTYRKDKSRINAQSRRTTHAHLLKELGSLLPFPDKVVQQIDYNSILRLVLCYFRMKNLAIEDGGTSSPTKSKSLTTKSSPVALGKIQDLMTEALDGFVLVLLGDGTIVYLSDNIHKYLGLFQSEHIGTNFFDLVLNEDHRDVKDALKQSEINSMSRLQDGAPCSFFCRMKCPKFKMAMCAAKSPGYKLMYISGHFKMDSTEPRLVAIVRPVSPPSILEIRMEGNMFVTHYQLDMRCTFFDGRLQHLLGYSKADMLDKLAFDLHHHDDIANCQKCHASLLQRGEGVSGYYRLLNKHGQFIWCQTRAHMMFDSRSGKPSYIVCMNFIINKKDGDESLAQRAIEASKEVNVKEEPVAMPVTDHSYDPFPVVSDEWAGRNPFADDQSERRSSPEQEEPDSTVMSRTPSPSIDLSKSPKSYSANPSPQLNSQLPVDNRCNTIISPISKHSVSSVESGYESSLSTPPGSVQMGSINAASPVFHQEMIPELIPAQMNGNAYQKQNSPINIAQNTNQQIQNPLVPAKQYTVSTNNIPFNPRSKPSGGDVKQESPFIMHQCAGSKRSHQSVQQPTVHNKSQDFAKNVHPVLGVDMLMSSFDDSIPPIAPLKELKTEDLDILEIPAPPLQNIPQIQQPAQWPGNMQYIPNGRQFAIPTNNNIPRNIHRNVMFNPMQQNQHQQFKLQPQFLYNPSQ